MDDLFRNKTKEGYVMWIGLNPSTADDSQDDPTIRRCIDFTKRFGYLRMVMTNLFAYRATDPREMKKQPEPVGPDNDCWLVTLAKEASLIIAAWGGHGEWSRRDYDVMKLIGTGEVHCLRKTKFRYPEHPLYLPKTLTPIPYVHPNL